jgi:rhodanese-related sulfurtransferase
LFGRAGERTPVLGTAIVRVFEVVAATTGQSEKSLKRDGRMYRAIHLHPGHHAGYFPGAKNIHLKVLFDENGLILGAQATGAEGIDKRIDVLATAIRAGMHISDLAELELAYAPPFGSAKDPINMAGFIGENVLSGDLKLWSANDLDNMPDDSLILDVRSKEEYESGHFKGALHVPHTELRERIGEVPSSATVFVHCASGFRSYLATRILRQKGWSDVRSLDGGLQTFLAVRPDFVLEY